VSMWLKKITLRHAEHEGTQRKPLVKLSGLSALVVKKNKHGDTENTEKHSVYFPNSTFYIGNFTLEISN